MYLDDPGMEFGIVIAAGGAVHEFDVIQGRVTCKLRLPPRPSGIGVTDRLTGSRGPTAARPKQAFAFSTAGALTPNPDDPRRPAGSLAQREIERSGTGHRLWRSRGGSRLLLKRSSTGLVCGARMSATSLSTLFTWEPEHSFDVLFFSFWLSHVARSRFSRFWELVSSALAPSGTSPVFPPSSLSTMGR